jgi:hypothetical protein
MLRVAIIAASRSHGINLRDFFGFVFVLGIVLCAGTGLICAAKGDREGSSFVDPADIGSHWRGYVRTGAVLIVIGLLGLIVVAIST